jgi:hypothetical protein
MAEWNIVRNDPNYPEPLDPEIIPLCDALNAAGFLTTSSCCGHGDNWPYVYFEHSSDERIEELARFVIKSESGDYRSHFTQITKEILEAGYRWCLEIHLNLVYSGTPKAIVMQQTVVAINSVAEAVRVFSINRLHAAKG